MSKEKYKKTDQNNENKNQKTNGNNNLLNFRMKKSTNPP